MMKTGFFFVLLALSISVLIPLTPASVLAAPWVAETPAQRRSAIAADFDQLSASQKAAYRKFIRPGGVYDLLRGPENEVRHKLTAMAFLIPDVQVSSAVARKVARWLSSNAVNELWENELAREGSAESFSYNTRELGQNPVVKSSIPKAAFLALQEILKGVSSVQRKAVDDNVLADTAVFLTWMKANEYDIVFIDDAEVESLWKVVPNESGETTLARMTEAVRTVNTAIAKLPDGVFVSNGVMTLGNPEADELARLRDQFVEQFMKQQKGVPAGGWSILIRIADSIKRPFLYDNTAFDYFLRGWLQSLDKDSIVGAFADSGKSVEEKRAYAKQVLFWMKVIALEYNRNLPRDASFNDLRIDVSALSTGVEMIRLWAALFELQRDPAKERKGLFGEPAIDREALRYAGALDRHYGAYQGVNIFLAQELHDHGISPQDFAQFQAEEVLGAWVTNDIKPFEALVHLQTLNPDVRRRATEYFHKLVQSNPVRGNWVAGPGSTEHNLAQSAVHTKFPNTRAAVLLALVHAIKVGQPNFKASTLKSRADLQKALGELASLVTVTRSDLSALTFQAPAGPPLVPSPKVESYGYQESREAYFRVWIQTMFMNSPIPGVHAPQYWATSKFQDHGDLVRLTRLYALYLNQHLAAQGAPADMRVNIDRLFTQSEMNRLGSLDHSVRAGRWRPKVSCEAAF